MSLDKTRLWQVLATIPKNKQRQVQAFVAGTSTDKETDLLALLRVLFISMEMDTINTRPQIWGQVWQHALYDEVKLRRSCSDLLHRVENWVLLQRVNAQSWERERLLCNYFTTISEAKLATFYYNAILEQKKKFPHRDLTYYYGNLLDDETGLNLQDMLDAQIFDHQKTEQNIDAAFVLAKLKNSLRI